MRIIRYGLGILAALGTLHFLLAAFSILIGNTVRPSEQPLVDGLSAWGMALIFGSAAVRLFRPDLNRVVAAACAGAVFIAAHAVIKPHPTLTSLALFMSAGVLGDVAQTLIRAYLARERGGVS